MKKLLLGGMLAASMFAQVADAGAKATGNVMAVKGSGCAITTKPIMTEVVLTGVIEKNHNEKIFKAGDRLTREQNFTYNFSELADCGLKYVMVEISKGKSSWEEGLMPRGAGFGYDRKKIIDLSRGTEGTIKLFVDYEVIDPWIDWKLTRKFKYYHKFEMKIFVKQGW